MALAAAAVYVFATNSEVVWLYLVAGMLLALLPIGVLAPPLALRRLRIEAGPWRREGFSPPLARDRGALFAGDRVVVELRARRGSLAGCAAAQVVLGGGGALAAEVAPDPAGRTARLTFAVPRRGRWRIVAVELDTGRPLGLVRSRRRLPLHLDLLALPRYRLPPGGRPAEGAEAGEAARRRGAGEELLALREYRPGDARRRIHWRTTARAGRLMVVETATPTLAPAEYRVRLAGDATQAAQDLAAEIAASLIAGSVAAGRRFSAAIADQGVARGWRDAAAALALAGAGGPTGSPPASTTAIAAEGDAVAIAMGGSDPWRLPAGASPEEIGLLLASLASAAAGGAGPSPAAAGASLGAAAARAIRAAPAAAATAAEPAIAASPATATTAAPQPDPTAFTEPRGR
jgi:uncharacterized protein (DUF58 family)